MQALDDTMITGEPKYSINITKSKKSSLFKSELQWKRKFFVC